VQRRAARRVRLLLIGLALVTVLVLGGGYIMMAPRSDGRPRSPLIPVVIIVGVLGLTAVFLALSVWAVRRRGVSAISPLWGVDRATRTRIAHALKHQQELTGQDQELAISEAIRSRKLAPLAVTVMIVASALVLPGIVLSLSGDVGPAQLGLHGVQLASICALTVHQIVFYRRAGAYLERFGAPPPEPGSGNSTADR
jgi:hypothetical protein